MKEDSGKEHRKKNEIQENIRIKEQRKMTSC